MTKNTGIQEATEERFLGRVTCCFLPAWQIKTCQGAASSYVFENCIIYSRTKSLGCISHICKWSSLISCLECIYSCCPWDIPLLLRVVIYLGHAIVLCRLNDGMKTFLHSPALTNHTRWWWEKLVWWSKAYIIDCQMGLSGETLRWWVSPSCDDFRLSATYSKPSSLRELSSTCYHWSPFSNTCFMRCMRLKHGSLRS